MDLGEALREALQAALQAATLHPAEAVEAWEFDGMQDMRIPMREAPQAVTRHILGEAVAVPRVVAPGMSAPFGVYLRKFMQPKLLCIITVAAAAHQAVTSSDPTARPAVAAVDTLPIDSLALVSCIQPTWGQRLTSRP